MYQRLLEVEKSVNTLIGAQFCITKIAANKFTLTHPTDNGTEILAIGDYKVINSALETAEFIGINWVVSKYSNS
jgi:hypothetical protein